MIASRIYRTELFLSRAINATSNEINDNINDVGLRSIRLDVDLLYRD